MDNEIFSSVKGKTLINLGAISSTDARNLSRHSNHILFIPEEVRFCIQGRTQRGFEGGSPNPAGVWGAL